MSPTLTELLAAKRYLLLDFDGPVCAIFGRRPARTVVVDLLELLTAERVPIPEPLRQSRDPFDVLRHAATVSSQLARDVEDALRHAEVNAAQTATATPHAIEAINAWRDAGRSLAIVSNNSAAAVQTYLDTNAIHVDAIVARTAHDAALLKPSPHLVTAAITALRAERESTVLLGDSTSDIAAGRAVGLSTIGFANKPGKAERLARAGATVVVDDMHTILHATALASAWTGF
jgi:HAD superfamily hydrolase (TIGR01549 family)